MSLSRLSLNQKTTERWSVAEAVGGCVRAGIPAIGLWREHVAEAGLATTKRMVRDAGLRVSSLCRGGFLTARDWGLSYERSAQVGSLLATMVLETLGTQEYTVEKDVFSTRLAESYGDDAAAEVLPHLK